LFALFRLADNMVSFLVLLGVTIAPISGVLIAGAFDPRDPLDKEQLAPAPTWRFQPLLAWLAGAAVGYMTMPKATLGLGLFNITTVPPLDAVLAAAFFMLMVKLSQKEPKLKADFQQITSNSEIESKKEPERQTSAKF